MKFRRACIPGLLNLAAFKVLKFRAWGLGLKGLGAVVRVKYRVSQHYLSLIRFPTVGV